MPLSGGISTSVSIFWNEAVGATSAQAANGTFTGTTRTLGVGQNTKSSVNYVNASFYTDRGGTAYIDLSNDGSTWYEGTSGTIAGGTPLMLTVPLLTEYYRVRVVNGSTIQTYLWVNSSITGA